MEQNPSARLRTHRALLPVETIMDRRDEMIREYARSENIAAFTRQLRTETDATRRKLLETLISEHEALAPTRPRSASALEESPKIP